MARPIWRLSAAVAVAAAALVGMGESVSAQNSPLELKFDITDRDVDAAIQRLQNYLWTQQQDDGSWKDVIGSHYDRKVGGTTALCVLALLEAGGKKAMNDPRMDKALKALLAAPMDDLYCYSVRVMALSQAYRFAQREEFAARIAADMNWLTSNLPANGAWGYKGPERTGDNSCSQYGLLALWEADWAGFDDAAALPKGLKVQQQVKNEKGEMVEKPLDVSALWPAVAKNLKTSWPAIERQWVSRVRADHGWVYPAVPTPEVTSTATMTAAGVASLYIVIDKAYAPRMTPGQPRPATQSFKLAEEGMGWLAQRLTPEYVADGYLAFGVQRIAAAAGFKYIGQHDWFRLGVKEIARRAGNAPGALGGTHGPDVQAAYYLLFLARGRVPITFNKLERPGTDWDSAPRDVANLTRHIIIDIEERVGWQIVNENKPVAEFLDAPILFINGIQPLKLKSETIQKVREYVLRGGFLLGEATTSSREFAESFKRMLEEAFPEGKQDGAKAYVWHQMPKDHPILDTMSDRERNQVGTVWAMDDPVRTVAVLLTTDHATAWQQMDKTRKPQCFTMGRNIFLYAMGGIGEPLRTRLRPVFAGRTRTADVVKKIGMMHAGDRWLGEDYAVERLSDKLAAEGRVSVETVQAARPQDLDPRDCPVIWLTGRGPYAPDDATVQALKSYIDKGGLLMVNAYMGDAEFGKAAQALAQRLLPEAGVQLIGESDPIFTGLVYRERGQKLPDNPGMRISLRMSGVKKIELRGYPAGVPTAGGQRWGVIVSPYDMFMGILGTPIYGCKGYTGETAQQVATNAYLYALEKAEKCAEAPKQ